MSRVVSGGVYAEGRTPDTAPTPTYPAYSVTCVMSAEQVDALKRQAKVRGFELPNLLHEILCLWLYENAD